MTTAAAATLTPPHVGLTALFSGDHRLRTPTAVKFASPATFSARAAAASSASSDNVVTLLDYGAGNVRSLRNAIRRLGFDIKDVQEPEDILKANRLILPGVGAFAAAINVLNENGASFEDIRQSYRLALLKFHPDKLHKSSNLPNSVEDVEDRFMKVQKAWETLGNPKLRVLYDHKLRSLQNDTSISEEVALEDMTVDDTGDVLELCHECRCGDYFVISCSELEKMGYELRKLGHEVSLRNPEASPAFVILPWLIAVHALLVYGYRLIRVVVTFNYDSVS